MIIAQITDPHIRENGEPVGPVDTAACLEKAVSTLNALKTAPDMVLLTGDVGNEGTDEEYDVALEILEPLNMPLYVIPGNHDRRKPLREAFSDRGYLEANNDFFQYRINADGVCILAIDTLIEGMSSGRLCAKRLRWIDKALKDNRDVPVLMMMHHPPIVTGIELMDKIRLLAGTKELAEIVQKHDQIQAILCGHVHRSIQGRFAGTIVNICPGVAHQIDLDLRSDAESALIAEPPGYQLHIVDGEQGLTTHTALIGDFGDPVTYSSIFG